MLARCSRGAILKLVIRTPWLLLEIENKTPMDYGVLSGFLELK